MKILFANVSGGMVFAGNIYGEMKFSRMDTAQYADKLSALDADIVGLTEVHLEADNESEMVELLSSRLRLPHTSVHYLHASHLDTSKAMGTAILSRYPIISSESFVLESPKLTVVRPNGDHWTMHDKSAQRVTMQTNDGLVDVVNLSYFPFHHFNRRMDEAEFAHLRSGLVDILLAKGNPTIIMGDFNNKNVPFAQGFPELAERGFREALKAPTTVVGYPDQQLDHILYAEEYFEASDGFTAEIGSDHVAIGAFLQTRA